MPTRFQVLCGAEDGWSGMRTFSLAAAREDHGVMVLIRGALEPEVLGMITTPSQMRVVDIERRWFYARLLWELVWGAWRGPLRWVVVNRERTRRFLAPVARVCGVRVLRLIELERGYRLEGEIPESMRGTCVWAAVRGDQG